MGQHGDGDEGGAGGRSGRGATRCPGRARAGKPTGRQLAGDGTDDRPAERDGAQPLPHGHGEHGAARHRGEQEVADIARFDRHRSTVAPAAQPEGDGDRHAETEHARAAFEHVGHLGRRGRLVADEPAQPEHDTAADEREEVDAIGDLEPLEVAEPAHPPGPPQLLDDARHAADQR